MVSTRRGSASVRFVKSSLFWGAQHFGGNGVVSKNSDSATSNVMKIRQECSEMPLLSRSFNPFVSKQSRRCHRKAQRTKSEIQKMETRCHTSHAGSKTVTCKFNLVETKTQRITMAYARISSEKTINSCKATG